MSYVYCITNIINNKKYIGITTRDWKIRRREHLRSLRDNKHHNAKLQNAFNKYKEYNFVFSILFKDDDISEEELGNLEIKYISEYGTVNNGYNIDPGGSIVDRSTRRKMSDIFKSKRTGENHPRYGTKMSDEVKERISKKKIENHEKALNRKLSKDDIFFILCATDNYRNIKHPLARYLSVDGKTILNIVNKQIYKDEIKQYEELSKEQKGTILINTKKIIVENDIAKRVSEKRKLTKNDIFFIIAMVSKYDDIKRPLARYFSVDPNVINYILKRKNYRDYSNAYDNLSNKEKDQILKEAEKKFESWKYRAEQERKLS